MIELYDHNLINSITMFSAKPLKRSNRNNPKKSNNNDITSNVAGNATNNVSDNIQNDKYLHPMHPLRNPEQRQQFEQEQQKLADEMHQNNFASHRRFVRNLNDKRVKNDSEKSDNSENLYNGPRWNDSLTFTQWLYQNKCSLLVSSYDTNIVYSIGIRPTDGGLSIWMTDMTRPMGVGVHGNRLYLSNKGYIIRYQNHDIEDDPDGLGPFCPTYFPEVCYISGDADVHDVRPTSDGNVYFVLAKFNCVACPSEEKSFKVHWIPPWITYDKQSVALPFEDRCHLNGLCIVDDVPRYVTAACMGNFAGSWRETANQCNGVVFDIVNNVAVCENIWAPHSPRMYNDRLWLLESGTGYLGYVDMETRTFVKKKFLPGFLRGLDIINNYAVVTTSLDRHDSAFANIPLSKHLDEHKMASKCGIWVINLDTMDIAENIVFNEGVNELYDVAVVPGLGLRPKIVDSRRQNRLNLFHI